MPAIKIRNRNFKNRIYNGIKKPEVLRHKFDKTYTRTTNLRGIKEHLKTGEGYHCHRFETLILLRF